jgi:hypothetical protein
VDESASVAGGNFRAIRETNEVVVAIRAELAVEKFTGRNLERLKELSRLDVRQCSSFCFFSREKEKRNATSHTMTKSPSWISLFSDHIWRDGCCRDVSDYATPSEKEEM